MTQRESIDDLAEHAAAIQTANADARDADPAHQSRAAAKAAADAKRNLHVQVYHDLETDEWEVTVYGSDAWDTYCAVDEQDARDEAEAIAGELGCEVRYS